MDEIRVLTPTGMLGYGFSVEDFRKGLEKDPHIIAVDSGSTDSGPQKLGNGSFTCPYDAYYYEIGILLEAAYQKNIPLIITSSGGAGSDEHVDAFAEIVKKISAENNYKIKLAAIRSEIDKELIKEKINQCKIKPCGPVAELTEKEVDAAITIVAQMGVEPILKALDEGANVIISGRTYDPVPMAALGIKHGFDLGLCWHMGKVIECGALCAGDGRNPIMGYLRKDHFMLEPLNDDLKATEASVAAHTLYEKSHPYLLPGPGGVIDLSEAVFKQFGENCVKVSKSKFIPSDTYTVKLEGAKKIGYRSAFVAGMRDPIAISQVDNIIENLENNIHEYMKGKTEEYDLFFHVYGKNGVMGEYEPQKEITSHELGIVFEALAHDQKTADNICSRVRVNMLHYPYKGRIATGGNIGLMFTPLEISLGSVYEFNIYHIMEIDDPCEYFPVEIYES